MTPWPTDPRRTPSTQLKPDRVPVSRKLQLEIPSSERYGTCGRWGDSNGGGPQQASAGSGSLSVAIRGGNATEPTRNRGGRQTSRSRRSHRPVRSRMVTPTRSRSPVTLVGGSRYGQGRPAAGHGPRRHMPSALSRELFSEAESVAVGCRSGQRHDGVSDGWLMPSPPNSREPGWTVRGPARSSRSRTRGIPQRCQLGSGFHITHRCSASPGALSLSVRRPRS